MDNASSTYSLVLSIFWSDSAPVNSVSQQGVILHAGICQTSKQPNNQTNNKYNLCFWFGILAWVLDLGSWLGFLTWDLGLWPWLQTDMVFKELELSMILLDPQHILQMGLNVLHIWVGIHIPCRLTYFSDRSHNWDCQLVDIDLYDSISVLTVHSRGSIHKK